MPKHTQKNSSVSANPDKELLLAFVHKLQTLVGQVVPFGYGAQLYHYLSPNFFDKSAHERFHELFELRFDGNFEDVLHRNLNSHPNLYLQAYH